MSDRINLILLEFFVDSVKLDNLLKTSIPNYTLGKLCVLFKFLDFPPLQVNEDEHPEGKLNSDPIFRSGRSGLFSVPDVTAVTPDLLLVDIYVILKLPEGHDPDRIPIGQTKINMTQHFTCITSEAKLCPEKAPITRSIRESFLIADNAQKFVGVVSLFIRASCFGNMIVQQFKRNNLRRQLEDQQGPRQDAAPQVGLNRAAGDRAAGAATLKETLEKTLPGNLSQVLPDGLIDVIANCFSMDTNPLPVGLLESLRQGIVQGVRGVTGGTFERPVTHLQPIPESASSTTTAGPSDGSGGGGGGGGCGGCGGGGCGGGVCGGGGVCDGRVTSSPLPSALSNSSLLSPYQPPLPPPAPPDQSSSPSPYHHAHHHLHHHHQQCVSSQSPPAQPSPQPPPLPPTRCLSSPVQYPTAHMTIPPPPTSQPSLMGSLGTDSRDRCGTPVQYPNPARYDWQGAGERGFPTTMQQMAAVAAAATNGVPVPPTACAMFARQSAMKLAREASRSASKASQISSPAHKAVQVETPSSGASFMMSPPGTTSTPRTPFDMSNDSSSMIREDILRAHTGLYGGNEIILKPTPPMGLERRGRRVHRHHRRGKVRYHYAPNAGAVGVPEPEAPRSMAPLLAPNMSPQLEMHMQQLLQKQAGGMYKGSPLQMKSSPLQQLQQRMAAAMAAQSGGEFESDSKFDVIGTELGGMMLRIHVPKSKKVEATGDPDTLRLIVPPTPHHSSSARRNASPTASAPGAASPSRGDPFRGADDTTSDRAAGGRHHRHRHHRHHHHHHHRHHHHRRHHGAEASTPPWVTAGGAHSEVNMRAGMADTQHHVLVKDASRHRLVTDGRRTREERRNAAAREEQVKVKERLKEEANPRAPFPFGSRYFECKDGDRVHLRGPRHAKQQHNPDRHAAYGDRHFASKEADRHFASKEGGHYVYYNRPQIGREGDHSVDRRVVCRDLGHLVAEAGRACALKNIKLSDLTPEAVKLRSTDADSDVFVLKIGTKREKKQERKRDKLELMVRAPKKVESDVTGPPILRLHVPPKPRSKSKGGSRSNLSTLMEKSRRRSLRNRDKDRKEKDLEGGSHQYL